jgi:DNA (cytosine-5)-methyltransferase 1
MSERFPVSTRQRASVEWVETLSQYYLFVEKFRLCKPLSRGDIRAYISALTDIIAIEAGINDIEGIRWALREALKKAAHGLTEEEYSRVIQKWRLLDRKALQRLLNGGSYRQWAQVVERGNDLHVVSLFTGNYGLDLGFEYAGFRVSLALDIDPASEDILSTNRPSIPFIRQDIASVTTEDILKEAGLDKGDVDVITGGPPCQPFSTGGKRQGLRDPRASPLKEFVRVINEARPKAFVMEEVTGLLSARLKHVPIKDRNRELLPEERTGSVWHVVREELSKTGYRIVWGVLNAADFGAPQLRQRVIIVGLRKDLGLYPQLPAPTYAKPTTCTRLGLEPWRCILDIIGLPIGEYIELPPKYKRYMQYVPPGGNWRQIPKDVVQDAMNGAFLAGGGRMGFYRRLSLFEPSPTLVTSPIMKGSMLIHPIEDRPLSVNEYKVIQGFPLDWRVPGSVVTQYRKIGEAVPPLLSYAVAIVLREALMDTGRKRG